MGATPLMMTIIENIALRDISIGIISMKNSTAHFMARLLCSVSKIDPAAMRHGFLLDKERDNLLKVKDMLSQKFITIHDPLRATIKQICRKARFMKDNHNIQILLIDSLQNIYVEPLGQNKPYSEVSYNLKTLAKELNIPIVVTSQLSNQIEERENKRPTLNDFVGRVPIEHDADVALALYRNSYYDSPDEDDEAEYQFSEIETIEIIVAKNRSGPEGAFDVEYSHRYGKVDNEI